MMDRLLVSTKPTLAVRKEDGTCVLRTMLKFDPTSPFHFVLKDTNDKKRLVSGYCFVDKVTPEQRVPVLLDKIHEILDLVQPADSQYDTIYDYGSKIHYHVNTTDNKVKLYLSNTEIATITFSSEKPTVVWHVEFTGDMDELIGVAAQVYLDAAAGGYGSDSSRVTLLTCPNSSTTSQHLLTEPEQAREFFISIIEYVKNNRGLIIISLDSKVKVIGERYRLELERLVGECFRSKAFNNKVLFAYFN